MWSLEPPALSLLMTVKGSLQGEPLGIASTGGPAASAVGRPCSAQHLQDEALNMDWF